MTLTIKWQHLILILGFVLPILWFWIPYSKSGADNYGIGGLFVAALTAIVWLIALVLFFGLGYFGVFT